MELHTEPHVSVMDFKKIVICSLLFYVFLQADDVEKLLLDDLPPGYLTCLDQFRQALAEEATFRPFGELIDSYSVETRKNLCIFHESNLQVIFLVANYFIIIIDFKSLVKKKKNDFTSHPAFIL